MKIADRERLYKGYKEKYLGKSVKDGQYIQCVSLSKHYAKEIYGVSLPSFGGSAYSGYVNQSKTFNDKWKRVIYEPGVIPIAGDIGFHKPTASNSYGHTFICGVGSDVNKLVRLEQNYVAGNSPHFGKGTGAAAITERTGSYKDIVGFWRFIGA